MAVEEEADLAELQTAMPVQRGMEQVVVLADLSHVDRRVDAVVRLFLVAGEPAPMGLGFEPHL